MAIFTRFLSEGKATISFNIPEHDLQIKSEVIQLTSFLKVLKSVLTGETTADWAGSSSVPVKLPCLTVGGRRNCPGSGCATVEGCTFVFENCTKNTVSIYTHGMFTTEQYHRALRMSEQAVAKVFDFYGEIVGKQREVL